MGVCLSIMGRFDYGITLSPIKAIGKDNSVIGALGGTGLVIFNSNLLHHILGPTHFLYVQINAGLNSHNHFNVEINYTW
jgi:hypothetical protein